MTSGAIVNAESYTKLDLKQKIKHHDVKKKETETELGKVVGGHVLNRRSGKDVETQVKIRFVGLSC